MKLREKQQLEDDIKGYLHWITSIDVENMIEDEMEKLNNCSEFVRLCESI